MDNRRNCPHLEINDLAEGTHEINEPVEPINWWEQTSIAYSDLAAEGHSDEEVHQVGIAHEGRDDTDAQDATQTMVEVALPFLNKGYVAQRCPFRGSPQLKLMVEHRASAVLRVRIDVR